MQTNSPTRRRWFRFSLRSLLVLVTLVCLACGYYTWASTWINQRKEYRKSINIDRSWMANNEGTPAPWYLRLLGESGVPFIFHRNVTEAQMWAVSRLFPESRIVFFAITRDGIIYQTRSPVTRSLPPIWDYPYYENGMLYREEMLEAVGDSK